MQPDLSLSAEISGHPGPLRWRPIPDISLLSPGLYLRYKGSLQLVAKELLFQNAVLYTVWDDEHLQYRFPEGWASPGLRAAFLVPTPFADNEGPPWIPIDAAIPDSIEEWDRGLLSSHLDPVHCTLFRAKLVADHSGLQVSADAIRDDGRVAADAALQETMAWLARNPESDHPAAVTARVMLVGQGHGLQRAGLSAMSKTDETTTGLLRDVLSVLAPEVAPVLQAVQALWLASDEDQVEHFVALARALQPHLEDERSPLQQPKTLAVLATWLTGIFGSRPDRDRRRPARSLFAALRLLRRLRGDLDALDHPDVDLPTFPTSRELSDEITRELSFFPQGESDLERLVRAMAVGESSRDFGRVTLDHLRPFVVSYRRVRGYPVATRTLLGRYDGIVTMWSFRGRELDDREVPARALEANLVFDTTTWASTRAYARVLGYRGAVAAPFGEALAMVPERGAPHHPDIVRMAELHGLEPAEIAERLGRASRARRPNSGRVSDAIGAHEYLVALLSRQPDALPEWTPIEPEWAGGDDCAVRRHFMYWRAYCRSFLPRAADAYASFLARAIPELDTLPWKLENEALALLRIWSRHADPAAIEGFIPTLEARLEAILATDDGAAKDERVLNILSVLASSSWEVWEAGVRKLLDHPEWADAEWHRILEASRHGATAEVLLSSDLFRDLATKLGGANTAGAASGRVEWARQLLGRGRGAGAVRWLLHREAWPEVVYAPAFEAWFNDRAIAAIEDPEAATVEVLELAAKQMTPETVDIAMLHLAERSDRGTEALSELLVGAERGLSLAAWLPTRPDLQRAQVDRALELGMTEARSGRELRTLAQLVFVARGHGQAPDDARVAALKERVQRHTLPDSDRIALGHLTDAWRLLEIELDTDDAANVLRQAALCFAETNDIAARRFLTWTVDHTLVRELGEDLFAALREPANLELLVAGLDDLEWPEAIKRGLTTLARMPRRGQPHRALWNALRSGEESASIESALDAEILRRAAQDLEGCRADIAALSLRVDALITEQEAQGGEARDASDDADEATAEGGDAQAADTSETSEGSEGDASGGARMTAAERFGGYLRAHAREGLLRRTRAALRFWMGALDAANAGDIAELPGALSGALASHQPLTLGLREDVLPRVVAAAERAGVKLADPRQVIANPQLRFRADASPLALDALAELVFVLLEGDEDTPRKASVTRDLLTLERARPTDAAADDAAAEAEAETEAETEAAEAGESDDVTSDDANSDDAAAEAEAEAAEAGEPDDDAASAETATNEPAVRKSALVEAWGGRAVPEDAGPAPARLLVMLTQRLAKRNDALAFRVSADARAESASLRWSRPRRSGRR